MIFVTCHRMASAFGYQQLVLTLISSDVSTVCVHCFLGHIDLVFPLSLVTMSLKGPADIGIFAVYTYSKLPNFIWRYIHQSHSILYKRISRLNFLLSWFLFFFLLWLSFFTCIFWIDLKINFDFLPIVILHSPVNQIFIIFL